MRRLHLSLRLPDRLEQPIQEFIGEDQPIKRTRLLYGNFLDDQVTRFVFYVEGDQAAYRDTLEVLPYVHSYDIAPVEADGFYSLVERELRDGDRRVRKLLEGSGAVIVPPVEYTSDGAIRTTILGDPESLRATIADLPQDIDVQLELAAESPAMDASVTSVLTDRQREAVAAATAVGYYSVPSEGSLEEVAAKLNCATSTASNHLRKAESKIMPQVADVG